MLKLPKFPLKSKTKTGEVFTALFKPTGSPKKVKLILSFKSGKKVSLETDLPEEVLSWGSFALRSYEKSGGSNGNAKTKSSVSLSEFVPQEENQRSSEPEDSPEVLPEVSSPKGGSTSRSASTNRLPVSSIIFAKDASKYELYKTAQSSDPQKSYLARFEEKVVKFGSEKYAFQVYFSDLREWQRVLVDGHYKLRIHKQIEEENNMPKKATSQATKTTKKPAQEAAPMPKAFSKNAPQATTTKGLTVYEAWGKAFEAHGKETNAPEKIVKFMEAQFPGRKTSWAKWVNAVRAKYNSGKLPGVSAPSEKLPVYK